MEQLGHSASDGRGIAEDDNCKPNCAQGKYRPYAGTITLSDPRRWGDKMVYIRAASSVPAVRWRPPSQTGDSTASRRSGSTMEGA